MSAVEGALSVQRVAALLEKCSHGDKDERYMATNDLSAELLKGLKMDDSLQHKICTAILKQLDDNSIDVQSVAIKCLGILIKKVGLVQSEMIADKLCVDILKVSGTLRDIYAIALKNLLADIPESSGVSIAARITPKLLSGSLSPAMICVVARLTIYIVQGSRIPHTTSRYVQSICLSNFSTLNDVSFYSHVGQERMLRHFIRTPQTLWPMCARVMTFS